MSASTSAPFGASVRAGADPNRALSAVSNRSSKISPTGVLAAEQTGKRIRNRGDGHVRDDPLDRRDHLGWHAGQGVDEAGRILGRAAHHVVARTRERPTYGRDQV